MKIIKNPATESWDSIFARPQMDDSLIESRVCDIIDNVRRRGDRALRELTLRVEGIDLEEFEVSDEEIAAACSAVSDELKGALAVAKRNIELFHRAQLTEGVDVETMTGVRCRQERRAIRRVGLYVPGGSAPLVSTVLMLALPARIAGCKELIICTPPNIAPEILYAAQLCGVDKVYRLGGAIAVAAMAYGTESVAKVDKIFGPGNRYVTTAKQLVSRDVAIDMPAGPSEVMIVADTTAQARFVAADMLSQLEHGGDSQAIAVVFSDDFAEELVRTFGEQLRLLSRREIAESAADNSRVIVVDDIDKALNIINYYAPEHLILSVAEAENIVGRVESAGSIFLGNYSPESAGDYASGTNHTLPTNGWARSISGVGVDSFTKKITIQHITQEGLNLLAPAICAIADAEGLEAHKKAVTIRL